MSTDTPRTDAGEAAAMYASEYHKVRQELEEAKKWRGVMTDIADKTQQRCAILESQLTAEQEKVKKLREALEKLHKFAFIEHGLDSAWVKPLNDARDTIEVTS